MNNFNVNKTEVNVTCNLTGDQWQLYTTSMDCSEAVASLNQAVRDAAKTSKGRDEFFKAVSKIQNKYADFGAGDSEPRWVLEDITNEIYGKEEIDW